METEAPGNYPFTGGRLELEREYRQLLRRRPVARVTTPTGDLAWLVTGYAECRSALESPYFDRGLISEPTGPRQQEATMPPDAFNGMRLLTEAGMAGEVMRHLSKRRVAQHRPWLRRFADRLFTDMFSGGPPADLMADFAAPYPLAVMCRVLGLNVARQDGRMPRPDEERLGHWAELAFSFNSRSAAELREGWEQLRAYLADEVARERRQPSGGMLSTLVRACDDKRVLDEKQLLDVTALLLNVGHKTLTSFLGLAAVDLLRHPEQARRLAHDPAGLMPSAVEELLRHVLIEVRGVARIATERVELGGAAIEPGDLVVIALHAADQDPRSFPDPDRLDLARDPGTEHLAFGAGQHMCPGSLLARAQITTALEALAPRLPALSLAVPPTDLTWADGLILRTPTAVPVTW
ncbi:cytochrome P450 [Streptomyces rimosus]|uniref:cytochrome P450 n=1 Tax=Streptomyces rimosus TaxID=1927 RepID=UPI0004C6EF3D|nr:cytochrome P450 [Streptomyces rimosus]